MSTAERQRVLGGIFVVIALATALALSAVLATVFFAITIAYVLSPARRKLRQLGAGRVSATMLVTGGAATGVVVMILPIVVVLFYRLDEALLLLMSIPETLRFPLGTQTIEIALGDLLADARGWIRGVAIAVSTQLPVLLVKFALFLFVVFALLHHERDIGERTYLLVPPRYRDLVAAFHHRARETLLALYVLQGITALATILLALPVFYLLGYQSWIALATAAGILQFVPVIGPSLLVVAVVLTELLAGELLRAGVVLVVGGIVIAAVPDIVLRPRLANQTTELSSTLYFVGFVGGMLSLGAIGVILGPLLVALLVEAASLVEQGFEDPDEPPVARPDSAHV